jgi:formate--tetrahydrofolate ligase
VPNLAANLRIVREVGFDPVVAINAFPGDTAAEIEATRSVALDLGATSVAVNAGFELGGRGAPSEFTVPVRELRAYTGAGWIVALCGSMMTMPGLPASPAAHRIDVDGDGRIVGLP